MICDFPEDNRFLSEEERAMVLVRLKVDTADTHMDHLSWKTFFWIMSDWKIYCSGFMYLTCVTTSYSIALFLPSILTDMVHSLHLTFLPLIANLRVTLQFKLNFSQLAHTLRPLLSRWS